MAPAAMERHMANDNTAAAVTGVGPDPGDNRKLAL